MTRNPSDLARTWPEMRNLCLNMFEYLGMDTYEIAKEIGKSESLVCDAIYEAKVMRKAKADAEARRQQPDAGTNRQDGRKVAAVDD